MYKVKTELTPEEHIETLELVKQKYESILINIEKAKAEKKAKAEAKAEAKKNINKVRVKVNEKAKVKIVNEAFKIECHLSIKTVEALRKYFVLHKNIKLDKNISIEDLYDINIYKLTKVAEFNVNTIANFVKFLERNNIPSTHEIDSNGRLKVKPILNNIDYSALVEMSVSKRKKPTETTHRTVKEKLEYMRIKMSNNKVVSIK